MCCNMRRNSVYTGRGEVLMKRKNMIIIAVVLLVVIAGGLTAYLLSDRGTKEPDEEDFLPAGWEIDTDKLEETTLTFYINAQRQNVSEEIMEAVNLKLEHDLKTKISFKYYWEYYDSFLNRLRRDNASGITCDAFIYSPEIRVSVKELADEGLIMDVSKLFPEYAPGYYNQFTNEDIKALNVNGGIYIIPSRMPSADIKYALVRQDLMDKYDIPPIKSYDDYEVFLDAVSENESGIYPMCYRNSCMGLFADMYGYVPMDYDTGLVYRWDDPSMKVMPWEQTPEFMECMQRMQKWYENGYLSDGSDELGALSIVYNDNTYNYDLHVTGERAASFIDDPSYETHFNTLLQSKGISGYSYKAYPLYDGYSARNSIMENGVMINPLSRQPDRVLMFIDWLQSDQENYDLLMYGKKDIHYMDMGDYIVPSADAVTTFLEYSWKAPFENIDHQRAYNPGMKEEMEEYQALIKEHTKYPPHYSFTADYKSVERIYEQRWMNYLTPEYLIYNGRDLNDERMTKFLEEQKKVGIDTMVAEVQNQLDAYMAENVR